MTLSMYQACVPPCIHALQNLSAILTKAENYAQSRKIDPSVLINARLYPDMFPLVRQIQIASDVIKGGCARLSGAEAPSFEDKEATFPELQERIAKTIAFIKGLKAEQFEGSETRAIALKVGGQDLKFEGQPYLLQFVIPNVYFHISIAYAILRHNGLDIGKKDYLGAIQ